MGAVVPARGMYKTRTQPTKSGHSDSVDAGRCSSDVVQQEDLCVFGEVNADLCSEEQAPTSKRRALTRIHSDIDFSVTQIQTFCLIL